MGPLTHWRTGGSCRQSTMSSPTLSPCDLHTRLSLTGCVKQATEASFLQLVPEICFWLSIHATFKDRKRSSKTAKNSKTIVR